MKNKYINCNNSINLIVVSQSILAESSRLIHCNSESVISNKGGGGRTNIGCKQLFYTICIILNSVKNIKT